MPSMNEQEFIGYVKAREADVCRLFKELDVNEDGCAARLVRTRDQSAILIYMFPPLCSVLCENDVGAALEGLGIDAATEDVHFLMEVLAGHTSLPATSWCSLFFSICKALQNAHGGSRLDDELVVDFVTFRKVRN